MNILFTQINFNQIIVGMQNNISIFVIIYHIVFLTVNGYFLHKSALCIFI